MIFAILAALVAVGLEFATRQGLSWWGHLWLYVPGTIFVSYAIWRVLQGEGWLTSIVLFSAATALLRIALTFFVLREPLSPANLLAAGALMLAAVVGLWK